MSRYRHIFDHPEHGNVLVEFGYDPPLSEYFLCVSYDDGDRLREEDEEDEWGDWVDEMDNVLFEISSRSSLKPTVPGKLAYSNSEIYKLMEEYGVPDGALTAITMDLPF